MMRYVALFLVLGIVSCQQKTSTSPVSLIDPPGYFPATEEPKAIAAEVMPKANQVSASLAVDAGGKFEFPTDSSGPLLEKLLVPRDPEPFAAPNQSRQIERAVPGRIAQPAPEMPSTAALPVPFPLSVIRDVQPRLPIDSVPLELARAIPEVPARITMPIGLATQIASSVTDQPVELSQLSVRSPSRASLVDPTDEFSASSVIGAKLPLRSTPAPFVQLDIPNPFENRAAVKLSTPIVVDPVAALALPPSPKP